MSGVLLFNPRAAQHKPRIPNSVLQVAASINGSREWAIVDGNLEADPWPRIGELLSSGRYAYFGCTVMPGPQLKQAIPFTKKVRALFPGIKIVWGGYFAANQPRAVLTSGCVDAVINGPGDAAFPALLAAWESGSALSDVPNLIYLERGEIVRTKKLPLPDMDSLPHLPYDALNTFYPLRRYLGKTYLGRRTLAYHSSFGCPFTCSFCAVVPIYQARWKGMSAQRIYNDVVSLKKNYGADAIEFHDNNFFVSEKRTVEFARLISGEKMSWWGEARIDTMDKYSDESLRILSESGCRMIFFGAETGDDEALRKMDKGGTQTGEQILRFAARLRQFGIVPEYSFVLGFPAETEAAVNKRIDEDIRFIKRVKEANPDTEIIIYTYSPVPTEGSEMFDAVKRSGFRFPETLDEWISPKWESFDLRKNPLTPWLKPYMVDKIRHFETVLNGFFPTASDIRLTSSRRSILRRVSAWRYRSGVYSYPKEISFLQRVWKYRQPETEGF